MAMHFFEQPCPVGWVYPCALEDVSNRLAQLPAEDVAGLWAVGLVSATRKRNRYNGTYFYGNRPTIHLYSVPYSLQFKMPPSTKRKDIETYEWVELSYGMKFEQQGSRIFCQWSAADLRHFIVEHVLLHEVGHHVYHRRRQQLGYDYKPWTTESEQFAEAYALRHSRASNTGK